MGEVGKARSIVGAILMAVGASALAVVAVQFVARMLTG
jgi:hypothetical protein